MVVTQTEPSITSRSLNYPHVMLSRFLLAFQGNYKVFFFVKSSFRMENVRFYRRAQTCTKLSTDLSNRESTNDEIKSLLLNSQLNSSRL